MQISDRVLSPSQVQELHLLQVVPASLRGGACLRMRNQEDRGPEPSRAVARRLEAVRGGGGLRAITWNRIGCREPGKAQATGSDPEPTVRRLLSRESGDAA